MDQPRGRSPSAAGQNHSRGPSPQPYQNQNLDPTMQHTLGGINTNGYSNPDAFQQSNMFQTDVFNQAAYQDNQFSTNMNTQFSNDYTYNAGMSNVWQQNFNLDPNFNMQSNVNPADLSKGSSPQDGPSPGLLSPDNHSSPGPQAGSPGSANGQYFTPQHSRHTSLDPSSAYGEPYSAMSFQQHRRNPSDLSDGVSSASHSPYLAHAELHDPLDQHSPFLAPQQDSNTFGIEGFTINEPYRSPRLMPQMDNQLQMGQDLLSPNMMPDIYTSQAEDNHLRHASLGDIGQADQFAPPTINIEPAPVSRQASFGPHGEQVEGALSPPSGSGSKSIH